MTKKQRIRYELAYVTRLATGVATAATGAIRTADLVMIDRKYDISSRGIGGHHPMGLFVSGGDDTG